MRLFVAVWPSETAIAAIAALPRPVVPALRWTTPDQWHVTLAFLGDVPDEEVGDVEGAVEAGARAASPPDAVLGPATTRLGREILCVPVEGVAGLERAVRRALRNVGGHVGAGVDGHVGAGKREEDRAFRPFRGHCTLARARRGRAVPPSLAGVPITAGWTVSSVCLVRSTLDPAGARYETLFVATVPS